MEIDLSILPWNRRLVFLRILKGWSQSEAAFKCSKTQKVYWSWESGSRYPVKKNQELLAEVYEVKKEDIFN